MTDEDIHAFRPAAPLAPAAAAATPRRRSGWRTFFVTVGLLSLLAIVLAVAIVSSAASFADHGITVVLDDDVWHWPFDGLPAIGFVAALVVACVLLLVVPVVVAVALLAVAFALGAALLTVLTVVLAATSPLWLLGLLIWWLARPRPARVAA
jgi:hypothetical protein